MATTMPASPVRSKAISGSDRSKLNKSFFDRRSLPSYQVVNSPIVSLPSRVVSASRNSFSMAVAADAARAAPSASAGAAASRPRRASFAGAGGGALSGTRRAPLVRRRSSKAAAILAMLQRR